MFLQFLSQSRVTGSRHWSQSHVTEASVASLKPVSCHWSQSHVTEASLMSLKPVSCHWSQSRVTEASLASLKPVSRHWSQSHVTEASLMSLKPVSCHWSQSHVTEANLMSLKPVSCHCLVLCIADSTRQRKRLWRWQTRSNEVTSSAALDTQVWLAVWQESFTMTTSPSIWARVNGLCMNNVLCVSNRWKHANLRELV